MDYKKHLKNESYDIYEHYDYRVMHTGGGVLKKAQNPYKWIIGLPLIDLCLVIFIISDFSISMVNGLFILSQPILAYAFYRFATKALKKLHKDKFKG